MARFTALAALSALSATQLVAAELSTRYVSYTGTPSNVPRNDELEPAVFTYPLTTKVARNPMKNVMREELRSMLNGKAYTTPLTGSDEVRMPSNLAILELASPGSDTHDRFILLPDRMRSTPSTPRLETKNSTSSSTLAGPLSPILPFDFPLTCHQLCCRR